MTANPSFGPAMEAVLIGPDDPPAVETGEPDGVPRPFLLIADHAGNRVPLALGDLGLAEAEFSRHIGYDIGAAAVVRRMALRLQAPRVLSAYSRLVVDCNRDPADPTCIPAISDGVPIPGNRHLSVRQRALRLAAIHEPYHRAVAARLGLFREAGTVPWLLSVHSFTPSLGGVVRPWDAGVLWNRDLRLAAPLMARLCAAGLTVGDNEPYSGRGVAYTIDRHAVPAGLPHGTVEIRQDHLESKAGIDRWADLLAGILEDMHVDFSGLPNTCRGPG
ncbi:MAG: N-formylglutamate amidohydrolase [Magnetospirillum sp. WYHS-4]